MEDREEIARLITGKPCKMEDGRDDPLHEMDVDNNLELADQLLALIKELGYRKPGLSDEEIKHILDTQDLLCRKAQSETDDGSCSICRSIKAQLDQRGE